MAGWKKSRSANAWTVSPSDPRQENPPTEFIWQVPDAVWALDEKTRKKWFAQFDLSNDFCTIEDRWFLRGALELPYPDRPGGWRWGVWCEVDQLVVEKYAELEDVDGSNEPRMFGKLACKIPLHPDSFGLPVEIQFGSEGEPPKFFVPADSAHLLALLQRAGMDEEQHQKVVAALTSSKWEGSNYSAKD